MRLKTLLGDYPVTRPLKEGRVASSLVQFDFADVKPPHAGFKRVVRDLEFDVAEIAIVTFLMAKAFDKPYVLLPAVMFGRYQHPYLMSTSGLRPNDLEGKRVAIRSNSVTTVAWLRGILADDYGVDLGKVKWITFEEAHVAEFRDPPNSERAPAGKTALGMLLASEVDAAILSDPVPQDARLKPVIPDPQAAAADWAKRKGALQINHMVAIRKELVGDVSKEVFRLLSESKKLAERETGKALEGCPFGIEENRRNLEVAIDYVHRQGLIPRRYTVDELF
ncbi:MAG TPA: phosphate ABC transporter substrate-binding protein [Burkholderiales bacterium]|nr:phosphate ABC transporter substrate-binding protein [Burkholderiales bacterium]